MSAAARIEWPPYPMRGPASTYPCPMHGLAVALNEEGRIITTCPACVRVAAAAEAKLIALAAERLAAREACLTPA